MHLSEIVQGRLASPPTIYSPVCHTWETANGGRDERQKKKARTDRSPDNRSSELRGGPPAWGLDTLTWHLVGKKEDVVKGSFRKAAGSGLDNSDRDEIDKETRASSRLQTESGNFHSME